MEQKKTALLVEDEEDLRSLIAIFFGNLGYTVTVAVSGADGLQLMQRQKFDLILTDFNMPGMDGIEFLGRVEAIDPTHATKRILVTGGFLNDQQDVAAKKLADACLFKPFSIKELKDCLDTIACK